MSRHDMLLLTLQLGLMLSAAMALGALARRFALPAVVGEIMAGVLIGPTLWGALHPDSQAWLFPAGGLTAAVRDGLLHIGMLLFMFVAGLDVDIGVLRSRAGAISGAALLGVALPFALGCQLVLATPGVWGAQAGGDHLLFALFMGTALSISAMPVITRMLLDLGLLSTEIGSVILGAATLSDLIGWSLFAIILARFMPGSGPGESIWASSALTLTFFAVVLLVARSASDLADRIEPMLHHPRGLIGVTLVALLVGAAAAEWAGLEAMFGAFLTGIAFSAFRGAWRSAHQIIHQFVISFLTPLYFVSIGLKVNVAANFEPLLVLMVLGVAVAAKVGGAALGARLGGMRPRAALVVGFGLNARGAVEIILATVALQYGLISQPVFVALLVMAIATTVLSGLVIRLLVGDVQESAEELRTGLNNL